MESDSRHGMHVRLGDVLDDDRDIEIPSSDRLVIRSCYEPSIFVDERNRIDRAKMLVVFLSNFSGIHIILEYECQTSIMTVLH